MTADEIAMNSERARVHLLVKLRAASYIVRQGQVEFDRLQALAAAQGWTNAQIAAATGEEANTIAQRRRRGWRRGMPGRKRSEPSRLDQIAPRLEDT